MKFSLISRSFIVLSSAVCSVCTGQNVGPRSARPIPARSAIVAQAHRKAIQLQGTEYIVPELIVGGEWTSTITLTNRGTQSIPTTNVDFFDNLGNPMSVTFQITDGSVVTDTGFSFSLPVGTILEVTFFGDSDTLFGQGVVGCSALGCGTPGLYGEVALRNRNSTRPDFESVFPFEAPAPLQYMLFDGRNGYTTVLYVVNENTTTSAVELDIMDIGNQLVRAVNVTLGPLESQILTLHVLAAETIGIQGTLVFQGSNDDGTALITVTGLRINPSNSFTPLRTFVPAQ